MANRNLLVPGTGGITLIDSDGTDVGWPVLMRLRGIIRGVLGRSDDELFELMAMDHRPGQIAPVKTSLKPGTTLAPGWVLRVAYNQVQDFNKFRYDWRADLRHSAAQLKDFIEGTTPTGGKWNLVGHSQGGLLIILASKLMDTPERFSESVATVTLVGTLLAGTLNSAQAMLVGDNAGARLAPVMRRTIRTWPAIYQMLPSWPAILKSGGTPAADSRQLKQPGGSPGVDDIQPDLLLRAREIQPLLEDPLTHMTGVDLRCYWAKNRKTVVGILRPPSGPLGFNPIRETGGDGLVPYATTMRWLGGATFAPNVTAFAAPCEPHAYLFDDPTVVTHLRRRLR